MNLAVCLLALALRACAHEGYPIKPVRATLRLEPDRIVADLRADSIYWIEEVTHLHPMPAVNWPADARARTEEYVNAHFRLTADGRQLTGRLTEVRYRQLPWEVNEEGTFFLRLIYPAAAPAAALTGTASFYEEHRRGMMSELAGRPLPYGDGYRVFVEIPGRNTLRFTLTPDAPSFLASVNEARRSAFAMALEGFARGVDAALGSAACFPALLAAALCLGAEANGTSSLLAAAAGGFLTGSAVGTPPWTPWAATFCVSLAAGRARRDYLRALAALAIGCLASVWGAASKPLLPHAALAVPAALIGSLAAGAALLVAARLVLRAEWRRLWAISESRVEELFARNVRLTATALSMVGAYGLWQSLTR